MRVPPALRRYLAETFSIDLRTLALFRACLGAVLCVTLLLRFEDLTAFYADGGVMPRAWLLMSESPWHWSLHFANGSALFQGTLLALQALLALCLAIGYRTRLAVVLSWLLLLSLHGRNPLVLAGGDDLMACLLFWAMFLPLAARWSVDAALSPVSPPADTRVLSWASAGVVLQVASAYFFGALLWAHAAEWVLPLGLAAPVLMLSPFLQRPLRFVVLLVLAGMHLGLAIGHFTFVSLTALTVLLGGWWWEWLGKRRDHGRHIRIYYDEPCAFCLKACLLLRHLLVLPRAEILPAQGSTRAAALMQAQNSWVVIDGEDVAHTKWAAYVALLRHSLLFGWAWRLAALRIWERPGNAVYDAVARHRGAFGTLTGALLPMRQVRFLVPAWTHAFAAVVLVALLAWHLASVNVLPAGLHRVAAPILYPLRMDSTWDPFAPHPGRGDGWFVAPGQLVDGTEVDALRPSQRGVDFTRPATAHKNARWQSFHAHLNAGRLHDERQPYARYLCRRWNDGAADAKKLSRFRLTYMLEETRPDGTRAPVEQHVIWRYDCLAAP